MAEPPIQSDELLIDPADDDAGDGTSSPTGLSARQEAAIVALLDEPTLQRAATKSKIGVRTIKRWLDEDPKFIAAYRKARRIAFTQAISMCQRYAPNAVNILARVMADPQTPPNVKVTATSQVLKFGREGMELDDLAARVEVIEQQMKSAEQAKGSRS
jgi:hypothetical protein